MNGRVRYGLFRLALIALLAVTGFVHVAPSVFAADELPGAVDADGELDPSFGTGGKVTTNIGSDDAGNLNSSTSWAVKVKADSRCSICSISSSDSGVPVATVNGSDFGDNSWPLLSRKCSRASPLSVPDSDELMA